MTIGKVQIAAAASQAVPGLAASDALAIGEALHKIISKSESHDLRHARYLRKQIGKQLGAAGHTIHALRGEVALLRQEKQRMIHQAIDQLIADAVVHAVPIEFGANGVVVGQAEEPPLDVEAEPIGTATLGEVLTEEEDVDLAQAAQQ